MTTTRETPRPDLHDPALRIVREGDDGSAIGFVHLDRQTKKPVAWSAVDEEGAISVWGWLAPGTAEPVLDPQGNPVEFVVNSGRAPADPTRRSPRVAVLLGVGVVVALIGAFLLGGQSTPSEPAAAKGPGVDLAVSGPLVTDGSNFDFTTLAGQDTVLFFYAPWCPHCQASGPVLSSAAGRFGEQVRFVTISGRTDPNYPVPEYLAQFSLQGLTNVDDSGGTVFAHFGQSGVPAWIFVNDDGSAWIVPGRQSQEVIDENIQRLLNT